MDFDNLEEGELIEQKFSLNETCVSVFLILIFTSQKGLSLSESFQ